MTHEADPKGVIQYRVALTVDQRIKLDPAAVRSLGLREVNVKEAFTLRDLDGNFYRAQLVSCERDRAEAVVYERMARSPESSVGITLLCAVLSRQRMLTVCQKATELGVRRIVPVFTERSVGPEGMAHEKSHAWPGQIVRAVKQCRRASVPVLREATALAAALAHTDFRDSAARYVLDDRPDGLTLDPLAEGLGAQSVALVVGPEGGFSALERELLAGAGARTLWLGGRVLRAETAVLVGLSVIAHRLGDLHVL